MANYLLASIRIIQPFDPNFDAGDLLFISWDSVAEDFYITRNGSDFTTNCLLGKEGVHYSVILGITSSENGYSIAGYSFCDDADLVWFRMVKSFPQYPFFEKMITVDSPVCDTGGGAVCDISFVGPFVVNHSVDQSTGGSVQFQVASSNGTVKYSLRDFDYNTSGNVASAGVNTLSGIVPGNWVLYIKDANDCTAIRGFTVLFKPVGLEHYRFTWASTQQGQGTSRDSRIRIYEREYIGSVVEVDFGTTSPFKLNKPKQGEINDKFYPIHPTNATLSLIAQKDYQFLPLFTQDNKKFRVVYEVDEGSGFTPIWSGFIVPSVYREDFIAAPYAVEIQIGDNVKTLEQEKFTDDDGNLISGSMKVIEVIATIMKKTGLSLNIRCGVNIFETNHNTDTSDDPFDQTYVDLACYRKGTEPFNCWQVLESILRPFGARIYQYDNSWIIEEIDQAVAEYAYRVFDSSGVYVSNSTFDTIIEIKSPSLTNRAALIEMDQSLEVIPAYGKITITSNLNYVGSIVAGGFEKDDLLSPESEVKSQGGIYLSEEGFNGWTLRHNGTSGVSFGRVITGDRGEDSQRGVRGADANRSVGAFSYLHGAWSGNLRNAYIESAVKNYQYGPGDDLRIAFDYSTSPKPEYEFMVLRFMIKVGSNYLQPDGSWDTTEAIYRAYPQLSNSLQTFDLTVAAPTTTEIVDTTIQVRIYFYAPAFFDYGLPPLDTDPANGTDGVSALKALPTVDLDWDYRVDLRRERTIALVGFYYRHFYQLQPGDDAEDVNGGIIHPNDFNSSTNPVIWKIIKSVNIKNEESNTRLRGLDLKFYIDNVSLDALVGGQPPPTEDVISLEISKYINETLELPLYNFDLPDITNGKNMYNNYFRLSDGTPTSAWSRAGLNESLTLQQILLKVLGGNHSAPTFRLTGSIINEFSRIGINNYLKLTKPGSTLSANNTEFSTDLTGWSQSNLPLLTGTWVWTSSNSGSAGVTLSGEGADSKKIYQNITHNGGYIEFTVNIKAIPSSAREDVLWVLFYKDGAIIHTEKMKTFAGLTSESDYDFTYIAFAPGQVDRIGFFIRNVSGSGECTYQVGKFAPTGKDIVEVFQITDYQQDERSNKYVFELMQQSKTFVSLAGIDDGGNNQSGSTTGREHSSAYSSAYS